ncbi:type IX secretion system sortase PorU [Algoriphagus sp. AGSA1]|uniref:type IX secretion system sortase PorU n=1 Tax=Algoriphagus sp. AGSA1 TaxID=2907213 RepID=UPI001F26E0D9|nr:type IX secretion system sortase PorU [Algoriphagus sp. AGSA1]MCE7053312.1 type IX secretion system sortase PorU [Algoriphagus sp. AGSA1]
MKSLARLLFYIITNLILIASACAQNPFYKFKVPNEGVYKISTKQAKELGASSLGELTIYGNPGMLPQLVDSNNLELQEIPGLEKNGFLYFYLPPSDSYSHSVNQTVFSPNQFTDSLSFLIGFSSNPKGVQTITAQPGPESPTILYEWKWLKEEENNILNSGRTWYSRAVAPGVTRGYAFPLSTDTNAAWKVSAVVMGRSVSESTINLSVDDLTVAESIIQGVPANTYGVKGFESYVEGEFFPANQKTDRLRISYMSPDPNARGYFHYIGIGVPHISSSLDKGVYTTNQTLPLSISTLPGLSIWEVSDVFLPIAFDLTSDTGVSGQKFIVFKEEETMEISEFETADLSLRTTSSWPELLIVTHESLKSSAERLSTHKFGMGVYTEVAYLNEIYDAFGYGNPDLTAIRNFLAWHYHRGGKLKNVLILGKGTFDYKGILGGRPSLVPIYTSRNSLNPLTTFSSDDYLSLLDYGQGEWDENRKDDELLQIGVGRLPVITPEEARVAVDKIIKYESSPVHGEWKKTVTFFADDGDNNIHVRDSESLSSFLTNTYKEYKQEKLYLDRYEQRRDGDRQSSPQAKTALEEVLERGTLLLNYVGHGNETTLTAEEVFLASDISNWANQDQLALWVTATCEFGRHDSPLIRSAAEELLIAPNKGAIGLLTTGRPVFSSVNFSLNEAFIKEVFKPENGQYQDLGSIFRNTKNQSQNGVLNRNFSLLADPSMRLASAEFDINITSLKSPRNQVTLDTLSALQEVMYEAEVLNPASGGIATDFNGTYTIELRDKAAMSKTLGDESSAVEFPEEKNILFKGAGEIVSGMIKGKMIIPKNINPDFGEGRIRVIGESQENRWEAYGMKISTVGGISDHIPQDSEGPVISAIFGGESTPPYKFPSTTIIMEASLTDSSGINISGILPEENLTVQVNGHDPIVINEFFKSENNTFIAGKVMFELRQLKEGRNLVTIRAWDILGNGSDFTQEIWVEGSGRLQILNHKTYPNPAHIVSHFEVEHNQTGENLNLTLAVYQTDGKILFSESRRLVKANARIGDLSWFFLQNQTKYPAKGTYIYKITLQSELDNSTDTVSGLIVIQ